MADKPITLSLEQTAHIISRANRIPFPTIFNLALTEILILIS